MTEVTELLPTNWNSTPDVYEIHYIREGKKYLLKGNNVGEELIVTLVVTNKYFAYYEFNVTLSKALNYLFLNVEIG